MILQFKTWLIERATAGDSDPKSQAHVFDFDDTLGITNNANGVMLYLNGQSAHKTKEQISDWLRGMGLGSQDLINGPNGKNIDFIKSRGGFVAYVSSSGLAKIQNNYPRSSQFVTGYGEPSGSGEEILIDFTPSSYVDQNTTKPINQTIRRMKQVNSLGSDTMVMTARKSDGQGTSIDGKRVKPTNSKDIESFLRKHGAAPTQGVEGVSGQNKGQAIEKNFFKGSHTPEELHFYDDLEKNTKEVERQIGGKTPAELHLYGPGEFDKGHASAFDPVKSYSPDYLSNPVTPKNKSSNYTQKNKYV